MDLNTLQDYSDRTFVHVVRLDLRWSWHIRLLGPSDLQCKEQLTSAERFYRTPVKDRIFVHTEDRPMRR